MKKQIRIFAAVSVIAMLLCSCGPKQPSDPSEQMGANGDTLFAPGTELSIAISSHASWPYNENWKIWEYVKEATGATFNVQAIPSGDLYTKLPLMMANSSELPDMIHTWAKEQVDPYATSGAYISYTDNMDKMPNMAAFLDSMGEEAKAELMAQRTSGDGKMYSAPSYGTQRVTNIRTWLYRKDIFEKHGLEEPKTYDELYAVAKKLKELYPDSYPVCFREGLFKFEDLSTAWQNNLTYLHYYDYEAKEWKFGAQQPVMKDIIEFFLKMADEGLVPPNFITIETKSWEELMSTDRGFITFDYLSRIDNFNIPNRTENPNYTLALMAPPVPDVSTGSATIAKNNLDFAGWTVCNTGDDEGIANSFKFIDWMYAPEAIELLSWGKEGETYTVNASGDKEFILEEGEQANVKYGVATYGLYQVIDQNAYESTYTKENIDAAIEVQQYIEENSNPTKWLALSEEEDNRAAAIVDDLRPYCEEQLSKFLLGQQPMSEWDNFQKGLVEMGVEELLEIYTEAYNRVMG